MRGRPRKRRSSTRAAGYQHETVVVGTVDLWGEVIEHEQGYRAQFGQFCEIVEVIPPEPYASGAYHIGHIGLSNRLTGPPAQLRRPASVQVIPAATVSEPSEADASTVFAILGGLVIVVVLCVALVSVACQPPHASHPECKPHMKNEAVPGTITEVSFKEHHGKNPDRWWLRVCDVDKNCRTMTITHAPWQWQVQGAPITVHWRGHFGCEGNSWWEVREISALSTPSP